MQRRLRPVTGGCVMSAKLAGCPCSQGGWQREREREEQGVRLGTDRDSPNGRHSEG